MVRFSVEARYIHLFQIPDRLLGPPNLMSNAYVGYFAGDERTYQTASHLLVGLRISGSIPPLTYVPSWHMQGKLYNGCVLHSAGLMMMIIIIIINKKDWSL